MERIVTLLEAGLAEEGYSFIHMGAAEECTSCDLRGVCTENLEAERKYIVTGVRELEHKCEIHGVVRVVEVTECEVETCIESKLSFLGSTITFEPQDCKQLFCKNFNFCVPEGLKSGDRCEILNVSGKVECEAGKEVVMAKLKRTNVQ